MRKLGYGGEQVCHQETPSREPDPSELSGDLQLNVSVYDQLWFAYGKFRQLLMPAVYMNYRNSYTWVAEENEL
ncbi:MAG: hypothetical protein MZV63_70610 [Marinilabiliales bacterium]|nr:hypothetical protein [Marinilabiliales bacterium]